MKRLLFGILFLAPTPLCAQVINQGNPGSQPWPVTILGSTTGTLHAPDIATVTTGGTAVNAFSSGHCTYGCAVTNPPTATTNLCTNALGTATTTVGGSVYCIVPGSTSPTYTGANALSVISSDSAHAFSGAGFY